MCASSLRPEHGLKARQSANSLRTAHLEGMRAGVGFPDLHPGKGAPTGAAFVSGELIYPHIIGSDIGCGMAFWQTDLLRRKAKLDRWAGLRFDLEHPWEGDLVGWLKTNQLPSTEFDLSMGTIGGGNHFAELQAVERVLDTARFKALGLEREALMMLVHSGSRAMVNQFCGGTLPSMVLLGGSAFRSGTSLPRRA